MVDDLAHCPTIYTCNSCGESLNSNSVFHCKLHHYYCLQCYEKLKRCYRGNIDCGSTCKVCNVSSKFAQHNLNGTSSHPSRNKPDKAGNVLANFAKVSCGASDADNLEKTCRNNYAAKHCIRLTKKEQNTSRGVEEMKYIKEIVPNDYSETPFDQMTGKRASDVENSSSREHKLIIKKSCNIHSKKPLICPHYTCRKMVAVSSFVSHFKHEHVEIPKFTIERRKDLVLPFSVEKIQHNLSHCLAMITVYDVNKIDLMRSRSSQSVINTCSKFCQTVPINTFWLIVTGSPQERKSLAYAAIWLLANTDDNYKCVIELSSKFDRTSCSSYCSVNTVHSKTTIQDIAQSLNCLLISRGTLVSLLHEGPELNLTVTVH